MPLISDIFGSLDGILDKFIPDKNEKIKAKLELAQLQDASDLRYHEEMMAQIDLNKAEAQSGNAFVAGWRPFIGWVCGVGLAAQVIVLPLLDRIFRWKMAFDTELLILTMSGMLGMGAMRSYEKVKGVSTNDYRDTPAEKPKKILGITLPEKAPWA